MLKYYHAEILPCWNITNCWNITILVVVSRYQGTNRIIYCPHCHEECLKKHIDKCKNIQAVKERRRQEMEHKKQVTAPKPRSQAPQKQVNIVSKKRVTTLKTRTQKQTQAKSQPVEKPKKQQIKKAQMQARSQPVEEPEYRIVVWTKKVFYHCLHVLCTRVFTDLETHRSLHHQFFMYVLCMGDYCFICLYEDSIRKDVD